MKNTILILLMAIGLASEAYYTYLGMTSGNYALATMLIIGTLCASVLIFFIWAIITFPERGKNR